MTAGSCFAAAGDSIITSLVSLLPTWNVRYAEPVIAEDVMNEVGEYRAVWIGVEGSSDFTVLSAGIGAGGVGYEESTSLTVIFQLIVNADEAPVQLLADEEVASAVGELVDLVAATPKPASALPDGWDTVEFTLGSISRTGGLTEDRRGLGRRVEVSLDVTARRC
jgi:hypothetical protein